MQELRKSPRMERWVIISTERGKRPTDFVPEDAAKYLREVEVPSLAGGK